MVTRMSSKGQIVIPRAAREAADLHEGTELLVRVENGGARVVLERGRKETASDLLDFFQSLGKKYKMKAMSQQEIDQAIMDTVMELDERTKSKPKRKKRGTR